MTKRSVVVGALGTAQTLAWGSSYYLPAILADPIAHGLGVSRTTVFGLFSGALLLSAVLGPAVGRAIDNRGAAACWRSPICCWRQGSSCSVSHKGLPLWLSPGLCSVSVWRWAFMIRLSPPSPGFMVAPRADRSPASP
jgi:hypothetical protein